MNTLNDIRFADISANLFDVLQSQGYFDFEVNYSATEQSINLTTHRKCYRYDFFLKTDTMTIFDDTVQLAFLIVLENLGDIDVSSCEYCTDNTLHRFNLSGFTNIKIMQPTGGFAIFGGFEGHRIICKITFKDISDEIILLRKHASMNAIETGIYRGIDPRYTVNNKRIETKDTERSSNIDLMTGYEFEHFCAQLLTRNGYKDVYVTKGSGDQGIDITAYKGGKKYGIQCKCYSSNVGNKAVMETYAGVSYYGCDIGVVMTNRYYTRAAIDMAGRVGVILWNRDDLRRLISSKNL